MQANKTQHNHISYLWDGNRQLQQNTATHTHTIIYEQDSFEPVAQLIWVRDGLSAVNDEPEVIDDWYGNNKPVIKTGVQLYHYHNDHLGTPNELTDQQGEVVWFADYEAWGNTTTVEWKAQRIDNIVVSQENLQPIRFQGQSFDEETGLHYNRFRYFDPDVGMFTTRNPIGLLGGTNVFQYAPNPIGWIDPFGLARKDCTGVPNQHFSSRREALRAIKRDAGIPNAQRADKVISVPLTDKNGKQIMIDNRAISTKEHHYTTPKGDKLVVQEHSAGHIYGPKGTAGNQGPHFNPRTVDINGNGSRNNSFEGLSEHYGWGNKDV